MLEKYRVALETSDYKIWHEDHIEYAKRIDKAARIFVSFIVEDRFSSYNIVATIRNNGEILYQHRFGCPFDDDKNFWSIEKLKKEFGKYFDDKFWNNNGSLILGYEKQRAGRPCILEDGKRVNVYLDTESLERAEILGLGNVSEGIRRALKLARI